MGLPTLHLIAKIFIFFTCLFWTTSPCSPTWKYFWRKKGGNHCEQQQHNPVNSVFSIVWKLLQLNNTEDWFSSCKSFLIYRTIHIIPRKFYLISQFKTFHYCSLFSLIFSNHYYFLSFNEESKSPTASIYSIINRAHLYCGIGSTLSSCVASLTISHLWDIDITNINIHA